MSADKRCPGCRGRMQRFFAMGVELDRCRTCQGVWLEGGELSEVLLRDVTPWQLAGRSERRCAFCDRSMRAAKLPGNVAVETCAQCRGIYLDEGELEQLSFGTEEHAPLAANVTGDRRFFFFYCVSCAERFPLDQGRNGEGGLHCPACAPSARPPPPEEAQPVEKVGGWLSRLFGRDA